MMVEGRMLQAQWESNTTWEGTRSSHLHSLLLHMDASRMISPVQSRLKKTNHRLPMHLLFVSLLTENPGKRKRLVHDLSGVKSWDKMRYFRKKYHCTYRRLTDLSIILASDHSHRVFRFFLPKVVCSSLHWITF
jgi:hypothetical protein